MEDIKVAYLPFNYVQLTEEEVKKLDKTATRSNQSSYPEGSVYTVTYEDVEIVGGLTVTETYILPVLYVIWPCDKPLPENVEYKIDYEVFIPYSAKKQEAWNCNICFDNGFGKSKMKRKV